MDNYDSDPNMQGDGPPMLVLGHVRKTGGATNRIIFDSTDHPDHARVAELADLEREIGRAAIAAGVIFNATNPEIDGMIARWRELHAEGAPE